MKKIKNLTYIIAAILVFMCASALIVMPQKMETWIDKDISFYNPTTGEVLQVEVSASEANYEAEHSRIAKAMAEMGYTQELGYDHDMQQQATAQAIQTGEEAQDILIDMYKNEGLLDENAHTGAEAHATEGASETTEASNEEVVKETGEKVDNVSQKKEYSHGVYDELSSEALNAFKYFLDDGEKNSCYIQVKVDAENKVMPADAISYTSSGHEDGIVQFVDNDNNVVYSVLFPQVTTDEDIDLTMDLSENEGIVKLSPATQKMSYTNLGYSFKVCINEKYAPHKDIYVYTMSDKAGETYKEYIKTLTTKDGIVEISINTLQDYYISETDLLPKKEVIVNEAEDSSNIEENIETPKKEEINNESATVIKGEETIAEAKEDVVNGEGKEKNDNSSTIVIIGICVICFLCVLTGIVVYNKKV